MKEGGNLLLDTSVVMKWFVSEEKSQRAWQIQTDYLNGRCDLSVPELLLYEVANALKFTSSLLTGEKIKEKIESLIKLKINIYPFDYGILLLSVDLAVERDLTIYDAYFLTLARETESIFITSDEKLYNKVGDLNFVRTL
jgi:predicted nucleic acid-binding protein